MQEKMTYWDRLREVIDYLEGRIDIYDGAHDETIAVWNSAWDEMVWMGIEPGKVSGIKKYIAENEQKGEGGRKNEKDY